MKIAIRALESLSKKKGGAAHSRKMSDRSKYLKMLFGVMKGELGDGLITSFVAGDLERFTARWNEFSKKILEAFPKDEKAAPPEPEAATPAAVPTKPAAVPVK